MEHRWGARKAISIETALYHNNKLVIRCIGQNIGRGGMFVKSGPLYLSKNTRVELKFSLPTHQGNNQFHLPAVITHNARDGLGLMFTGNTAQARNSIMSILDEQTTKIRWNYNQSVSTA